MGKTGPIRGSRKLSDKTVPIVSYNSGHRVVLGQAIISDRAFPEDQIRINLLGEEEIVANKMHDDPNYSRTKGPEGQEVGHLGYQCGSHCGVITVGAAKNMIRHCPCPECHNTEE